MITIPVPAEFSVEGRDDGELFEVTVTARIKDGQIMLESIEGVELNEAPAEEDFEMDMAALDTAGRGVPA